MSCFGVTTELMGTAVNANGLLNYRWTLDSPNELQPVVERFMDGGEKNEIRQS
jgi:hypothetical protein